MTLSTAPLVMNPTVTTPSHDAIARRAHDLWSAQGRPEGQDLANWLEAERQLTSDASVPVSSSVDPGQQAALAAFRRNSANAPRRPTHADAPKPPPPESGKPLWSKPHSA